MRGGLLVSVPLALAAAACGADPLSMDAWSARSDSIIGGSVVTAGAYSAVGAILGVGTYQDGTPLHRFMCTGTLVAADVLVSAAHCLDARVLAGAGSLAWYVSFADDVSAYGYVTPDLPADAIAVAAVVSHPDFDLDPMLAGVNGLGQHADVGFLILSRPATGRGVATVLDADAAAAVTPGAAATVVGYGANLAVDRCEPAAGCGVKRQATAAVALTGTYELQVGGPDPAARKCHGDSGGPTFLRVADGREPAERLVGVTSHAFDAGGCTTGAVDTRLDAYRAWLNDALLAACKDGRRTECQDGGALPAPEPRAAAAEEPGGCDCRALGASVGVVPWMWIGWRRRRRRRRRGVDRGG
ncbi:MAG: trypsin-like serine protease [Deltaproteobacteria bacterium]|nr:trypsin-like serine protease [Deltaproteobacteria bacterium]